MQTPANFTNQYTSPEVDDCIKNLNHELSDFSRIQGQADARKNHELSYSYFEIQVIDYVHTKVQGAIDYIKRILSPVAEILNTKELEQAAQKQIDEKENEANDKKHKLASVCRKRDLIIIDPLKKKFGRWLIIAAIIVGVGDAVLAFTNFIAGSYSIPLALLAAVAIGAVISISHIAYAPFIHRGATNKQKALRALLVLTIAFFLFTWLGNLRAAAVNDTVSIALSNPEVSATTPSHLNGWAICFVSFFLFLGILGTSLILWKDKKERLAEEAYDKLTDEICTITSDIDTLNNEKEMIIRGVIAKKSEARKKFDLLKNAIPECKGIGRKAIVSYKQRYSRFNHVVPSFFNDPIHYEYDETLQTFQSPQTEKV